MAPDITFFLPQDVNHQHILDSLVNFHTLHVDQLPDDFPCDFSAQRRSVLENTVEYLLVQYYASAEDEIIEMLDWERPIDKYKSLLSECGPQIRLTYRGTHLAKSSIAIIGSIVGQFSNRCIVENGRGCLLVLKDIVRELELDRSWTWERESFPEFPDVAISEWLESE